ncbi:uncharacterized protein QC761_0007500 [Podospora bellae-mahoneyi]|uniref:Uncharacterized protein n=1 Tax=Podospora bellae-mahoneyi TaxID=2093777 RepID=A0ABR0FVX0_9PEZI|nr:hypothetical protein QC761_0007500 [Podospora bellae-mahoneyi]
MCTDPRGKPINPSTQQWQASLYRQHRSIVPEQHILLTYEHVTLNHSTARSLHQQARPSSLKRNIKSLTIFTSTHPGFDVLPTGPSVIRYPSAFVRPR